MRIYIGSPILTAPFGGSIASSISIIDINIATIKRIKVIADINSRLIIFRIRFLFYELGAAEAGNLRYGKTAIPLSEACCECSPSQFTLS